jgi:hypothetical protein
MDGWCAGGCWFTLACNKKVDVNIYVGGMALLSPGLLHWIQFLEVLPH